MVTGSRKRPGRPTGADSERTHVLILDAARAVFADDGYASAQNARIAELAGVSPSTMYHYFPSKLDLYVAVFRDAEAQVATRYDAAIALHDTAAAQLLAILDAADALYVHDPSITLFLGRVPTEMRNHLDLARSIAERPVTIKRLLRAVIAAGIERGDVRDVVGVEGMADLFAAITVGIAQFSRPGNLEGYRRMLDAARALIAARAFV